MKPVDIKNFESICVDLSNNNNVGVDDVYMKMGDAFGSCNCTPVK